MSRELNSERSDCGLSKPHIAHPASSNFEGDVALQKSLIIYLFNKGLAGVGGKSTLMGFLVETSSLTNGLCISQCFELSSVVIILQ